MDHDKTYMWLILVTFIALAVGLTFSIMHYVEYTDPTVIGSSAGR